MQLDSKHAPCIVNFINCIIRYSIIPESKIQAPQSNALLAILEESDLSFVLKLYVDLNPMVKRYQMHLSIYNASCYKYKAVAIG